MSISIPYCCHHNWEKEAEPLDKEKKKCMTMERKCWLMNMLYNIWYYIPIWQREILSLSLSQFVFNDFTRKLSKIVYVLTDR